MCMCMCMCMYKPMVTVEVHRADCILTNSNHVLLNC